ncbi:MAG: hypothetical protein KDD56_04930, partial [Bdellovibrionales bacterium]|nr:hypothetical protein [Bdellovibrionales bacterium]
ASVYYFLIWINEDRILYGYLSMLFLALSFYAHYLFIFAGVTLDLILFVTSSIKDRKKNLLILSIFFVVLCLPGFFQIKYLWEIKNTLFFLPTPTFTDVLKSIFPTILIIIFLCAYLATLIAAGNPLPEKEKLNIKSLKLVFAWSVSGPIIFYFLSLNLGHSLFAERYFLWSYPGVAILFACLLANSKNSKTTYWKISLVFILILVRSIDRSWQFEDWKAAASYLTAKKTSTILAYTGLIELERLNSDKSDIFKEYLTAPLMYYKLSNTVPVGMNTDITDIKNSNDVVFVAISKYDVNTQKYIDQMIAKRVFNQEKVYAKTQFGLVKVYEKR